MGAARFFARQLFFWSGAVKGASPEKRRRLMNQSQGVLTSGPRQYPKNSHQIKNPPARDPYPRPGQVLTDADFLAINQREDARQKENEEKNKTKQLEKKKKAEEEKLARLERLERQEKLREERERERAAATRPTSESNNYGQEERSTGRRADAQGGGVQQFEREHVLGYNQEHWVDGDGYSGGAGQQPGGAGFGGGAGGRDAHTGPRADAGGVRSNLIRRPILNGGPL